MQGKKPPPAPVGGKVLNLPATAVHVPSAPSWMAPQAQQCWERVVKVMVARGAFDDDCHEMVAAYCVQWARFIAADQHVQKEGVMIKAAKAGGHDRYNPYLGQSNAAWDRMLRLACELGLTPTRRSKIVRVRGASGSGAMRFLKP